jgi:hypothetical protein
VGSRPHEVRELLIICPRRIRRNVLGILCTYIKRLFNTVTRPIAVETWQKLHHFRRVRNTAKSDYSSYLSVCLPACLPVRPQGTIGSHWIDLMKFYVSIFFENLSRKSGFHWNLAMMGTLYEDVCTLMVISLWVLLTLRNFSDKSCKENQNTHIMFNKFFSWKWCRVRGNVVKYSRDRLATDDNITRRMRFPCSIINAKDTPRVCNIYCFSTSTMIRRKVPQPYSATCTACLAKLLHVHMYFVVVVHICHATRFSTLRSRYSRQRSVEFFLTRVLVRSDFEQTHTSVKVLGYICWPVISKFWETVVWNIRNVGNFLGYETVSTGK